MVYVHLADGFEEIEAVTILDVLRRAGVETASVSIMGRLAVKGAHDITMSADILYENAEYDSCEMIVLPGGGQGTAHMGDHEGLVKHVKCFAEAGKWVAAICAAPKILGENGLLNGKKATIYEGMEECLKGALHSGEAVVADGNIITSRGPGTATDFAIVLAELLAGKENAVRVRSEMLLI